jgi:predicted metal-binding membrane protein
MWWIMMIAMMIPSATPVLLLFTALKRQGKQKALATSLSITFLAGYLIAWMFFGAAATLVQRMTENIGLTNGPMMTIGPNRLRLSCCLPRGSTSFQV